MLWEYKEIDPIILSVGEADEISIKDVADSIVKHVDFQGDYSVGLRCRAEAWILFSDSLSHSLIHQELMGSTKRQRATRS